MKIYLNGKETALEASMSLDELLKRFHVAPEIVACELNQRIVRRSEYACTFVQENDELEIIRMIGGG